MTETTMLPESTDWKTDVRTLNTLTRKMKTPHFLIENWSKNLGFTPKIIQEKLHKYTQAKLTDSVYRVLPTTCILIFFNLSIWLLIGLSAQLLLIAIVSFCVGANLIIRLFKNQESKLQRKLGLSDYQVIVKLITDLRTLKGFIKRDFADDDDYLEPNPDTFRSHDAVWSNISRTNLATDCWRKLCVKARSIKTRQNHAACCYRHGIQSQELIDECDRDRSQLSMQLDILKKFRLLSEDVSIGYVFDKCELF